VGGVVDVMVLVGGTSPWGYIDEVRAVITPLAQRAGLRVGVVAFMAGSSPTEEEVASSYVLVVGEVMLDLADRVVALWEQRDQGDLLISSRYSDDRGTRPKEIARELERYVDRWLARLLTLETSDVRTGLQLMTGTVARDVITRGADSWTRWMSQSPPP
jgi:hypothetical protein